MGIVIGAVLVVLLGCSAQAQDYKPAGVTIYLTTALGENPCAFTDGCIDDILSLAALFLREGHMPEIKPNFNSFAVSSPAPS